MTNLFLFGNENIELLRKWESPLVCSLASKQTFFPKTGGILLLERSLERKELTTVDIWKGHNNSTSATIISYSKPWFILENAHMLFFLLITVSARLQNKSFPASWIGRKRLQKVQKSKQEQKKNKKNALFAYYYANVRPLGCHLLVVFVQASYRFLWGSKFCFNNSSLHDFSEWWKIK